MLNINDTLSVLRPLSPFNATLIQKVVNSALSLDPQKIFLIAKLKDKSLKIEVSDWNQCIYIQPDEGTLHFSNDNSLLASCTLSGSLSSLGRMALSDQPQSFIQSKEIEQSGDLHVLQYYQSFYNALHIDWEYHFQKVIGASATHILFKPFTAFRNWNTQNLKSSQKELDEYLHEELRLFPPREEVEDFFEDVYTLREDVERIEAHINHLKNKHLKNVKKP